MCYAIPGQVVALCGRIATVEYFGERRKAYNEFPSLRVGDFVYAQGGFVIKVVPPEEAQEILATWKETFFELQEVDLRLARLEVEREGVERRILRMLDKALEERSLSKEELLTLLGLQSPKEQELLYKVANFLRRKYHGNATCVHGILEISNFCSRNCAYCGLSTHNGALLRYRMSDEEVLEAVREAVEVYGFQALVLQSGEDPGRSVRELAELVREIKRRHAVLIFISFGEKWVLKGLRRSTKPGRGGFCSALRRVTQSFMRSCTQDTPFRNALPTLSGLWSSGTSWLRGDSSVFQGRSSPTSLRIFSSQGHFRQKCTALDRSCLIRQLPWRFLLLLPHLLCSTPWRWPGLWTLKTPKSSSPRPLRLWILRLAGWAFFLGQAR